MPRKQKIWQAYQTYITLAEYGLAPVHKAWSQLKAGITSSPHNAGSPAQLLKRPGGKRALRKHRQQLNTWPTRRATPSMSSIQGMCRWYKPSATTFFTHGIVTWAKERVASHKAKMRREGRNTKGTWQGLAIQASVTFGAPSTSSTLFLCLSHCTR